MILGKSLEYTGNLYMKIKLVLYGYAVDQALMADKAVCYQGDTSHLQWQSASLTEDMPQSTFSN